MTGLTSGASSSAPSSNTSRTPNCMYLNLLAIRPWRYRQRVTLLLEQHPAPPPCFAHTFLPSTYLPRVVITSSATVKARVPLKPSSDVVFVTDPTSALPPKSVSCKIMVLQTKGYKLLDTLTACDFILVDVRVVRWTNEVPLDIQAFYPLLG